MDGARTVGHRWHLPWSHPFWCVSKLTKYTYRCTCVSHNIGPTIWSYLVRCAFVCVGSSKMSIRNDDEENDSRRSVLAIGSDGFRIEREAAAAARKKKHSLFLYIHKNSCQKIPVGAEFFFFCINIYTSYVSKYCIYLAIQGVYKDSQFMRAYMRNAHWNKNFMLVRHCACLRLTAGASVFHSKLPMCMNNSLTVIDHFPRLLFYFHSTISSCIRQTKNKYQLLGKQAEDTGTAHAHRAWNKNELF